MHLPFLQEESHPDGFTQRPLEKKALSPTLPRHFLYQWSIFIANYRVGIPRIFSPSLREGTGEGSIRNHSNSTSLRAQLAGHIEKALSNLPVIKTTMSSKPIMSQTAKLQTRVRAGALTLLATLATLLIHIDGAQATAGKAYCWGLNGAGQLGHGTATWSGIRVPTPVSTASVATWQAISAGAYHTCGLSSQGKAYCWGSNGNRQLGDATTSARSVPTPVSTASVATWQAISAGSQHTCGLSSQGKAYCWGSNDGGKLGDGTARRQSVPTPVSTASVATWQAIISGPYHTCGLVAFSSAPSPKPKPSKKKPKAKPSKKRPMASTSPKPKAKAKAKAKPSKKKLKS